MTAVKKNGGDTSARGRGPRLGDRLITDKRSFDNQTKDKRAVAGLLFYKELDCLVDLAHAVSLDFFDRPQVYRYLTDDVASDLAELRARYGYTENFLSRDQRQEIFAGVFGVGDGTVPSAASVAARSAASFAVERDQLLAASAAFAERVFDTSEGMLRAAVRIMHVYLKDYLQGATGASVRWSRDTGLPEVTEKSYRILRDKDIAARFGVSQPPRAEWPYVSDANGSTLVEQISGTPMRAPLPPISRGSFNDMQQLGLRGAEAVATVMDYDGDPTPSAVDVLIEKCYTWYAARGRVLRLPVELPPAPAVAPAAAPAAVAPAISPPALAVNGLAATDANRSLYGPAPSTIPGVIS